MARGRGKIHNYRRIQSLRARAKRRKAKAEAGKAHLNFPGTKRTMLIGGPWSGREVIVSDRLNFRSILNVFGEEYTYFDDMAIYGDLR